MSRSRSPSIEAAKDRRSGITATRRALPSLPGLGRYLGGMPTRPPRPADVDAAMLEALIGEQRDVDVVIDPRDEMLQFSEGMAGWTRGRFDYFRLGHELARTVDQ